MLPPDLYWDFLIYVLLERPGFKISFHFDWRSIPHGTAFPNCELLISNLQFLLFSNCLAHLLYSRYTCQKLYIYQLFLLTSYLTWLSIQQGYGLFFLCWALEHKFFFTLKIDSKNYFPIRLGNVCSHAHQELGLPKKKVGEGHQLLH